jgi:ABC-type transport system involved in cytochrome bd biosynthesis fused ATPase/permease subunit
MLQVGRVGSGKSSLLSGMLGEVPLAGGSVACVSPVAYVSQQPWVINDTLRNNITFGREFDAIKFDEVIEACALEPDLRVLKAGAMTEIG